eukprot:jgi/Astpho2/7027/fgenesh1_pg.00107_%23_70_t
MPRRATLTFSSEDAPTVSGAQVYVYYCQYSGRHALTTSCNLNRAPKRRTDGARVIDTQKDKVQLYATDGGVKLLKRSNGDLERQYRLNVGKLPVAYRNEPEARFLYIMDGALTSYSSQDPAGAKASPVPPCIQALNHDTTQVSLEIDDRADRPSMIKISADMVRIEITGAVTAPETNELILEFMRSLLAVRLSQLSIIRGESTRHKLLMVTKLKPDEVYQKLQAALAVRNEAPTRRER